MATGLIEQMKSDLTTAMKARDTVTVRTLRSALTAIQEASVSGSAARDLDDAEVQAVLKTQVKRREEAAEAFTQGGRDESAADELAERDVLAAYLPAEMDDAALDAIVDDALAAGGFSDPSQMGQAMKAVMAAVAGRADGKRVSALVRERPGGMSEPAAEPLVADGVDDAAPRRSAAVVLGAGGARGYAHIGALEVLAEHGFEVVAVSGCSMGALVGGLYAAGHMDDYKQWAVTLGWADVVRMVDLSLSSMGAIRGDKLFAMVAEMVGDASIEDLPIAYTAVACDLLSQREVWFSDGPLADAIRASVAIPSLLTPVITDNQLLVDGALLNPVPILPTLSANADVTIAVSLAGDTRRMVPTRPSGPVVPADEVDEADHEPGSLLERVSRILDWDAVKARVQRDSDKDHEETVGDYGRLDIMNLAYETMQSALTSYKLAGYPPDVLVEIPKASARTFEFHRAAELIELGRAQTQSALETSGLL